MMSKVSDIQERRSSGIHDVRLFIDNFELTGWAAFVLLAFYMAVSNILLVNLLVAMFS